MKRFTLTIAALSLTAGLAIAQQTPPMPGMDMKMMMPGANDSAATKGYKAAMMKMMMDGMHTMKITGNADIDFMVMMKPHHQAAIDMAKVVVAEGKDAQVKKLAQEIIAAQEKEIGMIDGWLKANAK